MSFCLSSLSHRRKRHLSCDCRVQRQRAMGSVLDSHEAIRSFMRCVCVCVCVSTTTTTNTTPFSVGTSSARRLSIVLPLPSTFLQMCGAFKKFIFSTGFCLKRCLHSVCRDMNIVCGKVLLVHFLCGYASAAIS